MTLSSIVTLKIKNKPKKTHVVLKTKTDKSPEQ